MPGVHGKKRKKKKGPGFLFIGALLGVLLTLNANAYLPHKDKATEFRVVASSEDFSDYEVHGQIIGGSLLHPNLKVAGLLEMNQEHSAMKGLVEYQLNKYLKLGVSAGVSNTGSGLGDFVVTGDIPAGIMDILPFIKVSHEAFSEVGAVVYFTVNKVILNMGFSYQPYLKSIQDQKFTFMLGTGFK